MLKQCSICHKIQIQHLLKLNGSDNKLFAWWCWIQIQHLLKLNFNGLYGKEKRHAYSNTTLVKVKYVLGGFCIR